MRHSGKNVTRVCAAISIALTVMAGTALSVYSSDDVMSDISSEALYESSAEGETAGADYDSLLGNSDGDVAQNNQHADNSANGGAGTSSGNGNFLLPAEDLSQSTTSLNVDLIYVDEEQKKNIPVVGAVIDLYKVADLIVDNGAVHYILTDEFSSTGILFEGMTASESLTAAETLNSIVTANGFKPYASVASDSQGTAAFSSLDPGMYLGRQREMVQISDTKKLTIEPVLWMTPMYELNETQDMYTWNYSPTVLPKEGEIERIPTPTATSTPTPTPTPTKVPTITPAVTIRPSNPPSSTTKTTSITTSGTTLVKTGDTSPIVPLCVIAVVAIAVIIIVLRKRKK